jgi:hypothetical protein
MWIKCEVGCEKLQLSSLSGKPEMIFRTTQYIAWPIEDKGGILRIFTPAGIKRVLNEKCSIMYSTID